MSDDKPYQPKSVIIRDSGYENHLSRQMGVIDFDQAYANFFVMCKAITKLIKNTLVSIDTGTLKVPKNFDMPFDAIDKIDAIWNGTCFYAVARHPDYLRIFFYENPFQKKIRFDSTREIIRHLISMNVDFDELIPLPTLKNLIPVDDITKEQVLIQIRQEMPFRYAFEGMDYATLINDAKFQHFLSDGTFPKFNHEDMYSLAKTTNWINRTKFFTITGDYEEAFLTQWAVVQDAFQKIIDFAKIGDDSEFDNDTESTSMMDTDDE